MVLQTLLSFVPTIPANRNTLNSISESESAKFEIRVIAYSYYDILCTPRVRVLFRVLFVGALTFYPKTHMIVANFSTRKSRKCLSVYF